MAEANGAYDRGDYEDARLLAGRVLARHPTNVRMLRILVSAACIEGDQAVALANYAKLPPSDQAQMKIRCGRYGVAFPDTPLQ
jgi:cytochrome c-type biogenesis protein CcmH/NrfG